MISQPEVGVMPCASPLSRHVNVEVLLLTRGKSLNMFDVDEVCCTLPSDTDTGISMIVVPKKHTTNNGIVLRIVVFDRDSQYKSSLD